MTSHLWKIDTDADAPQLSDDGSGRVPYRGLGFACRTCHPSSDDDAADYNVASSVRTDAELEATARGYHD